MVRRLRQLRSIRDTIAPGALALLAVTAIGATGCGSDSSSKGAAAASAAAKLTGTPIKIGFLDPSVGAGGITQPAPGAKAAVDQINANGGVNGHPISLKACKVDQTPEKNISCANSFVQDGVVAVVDGFDTGSGAVLPILHSAKIPLVGALAFTPEFETDVAGSYSFGANQATFAIGPLQSFKQQGFNTVAFTQADVPASRGYYEGFIVPAARSFGLTFKPVYFPRDSPDFQTIASTLVATHPDIAGSAGLADEGKCTALVSGLRNAGDDKPIFAGFCTQYLKQLGAKAGTTEVYSSVWLPEMRQYAPPAVQQQLDTAVNALKSVPDGQKGYYTYATYAAVMTLGKVLGTVHGTVDSASLVAALKATKNMPAVLGPPITCDRKVWPRSSTCTQGLLVAQAQPDGSLKPLGSGFETVSPALVPKPPSK